MRHCSFSTEKERTMAIKIVKKKTDKKKTLRRALSQKALKPRMVPNFREKVFYEHARLVRLLISSLPDSLPMLFKEVLGIIARKTIISNDPCFIISFIIGKCGFQDEREFRKKMALVSKAWKDNIYISYYLAEDDEIVFYAVAE